MTETLDILKSHTQNLQPDGQMELAAFLLESVDPDINDGHAWREEIAQRVADIRSGTVTGRSLDEVLAELQDRHL